MEKVPLDLKRQIQKIFPKDKRSIALGILLSREIRASSYILRRAKGYILRLLLLKVPIL